MSGSSVIVSLDLRSLALLSKSKPSASIFSTMD